MRTFTKYIYWKKKIQTASLLIFCFYRMSSFGQVESVTTVQNLSFGAFTNGPSGGTITISNMGDRTASGSVTLLGLGQAYSPAYFDLGAPSGTIISITNGPDVTLNGSNGGTMNLRLGSSDPVSPLISNSSGITRITVGGTLTIGNAIESPSGNYSGTFYITFNNQ